MQYYQRIQNAINYIEDHLTDTITALDVAKEAFLSVPHLYKIFPIFTGQTVFQYIRKRRLSCSAYELRNTNKRVIDIALDFQFESQESYIRAFKAIFDVTPGVYRKSQKMIIPLYESLHISPYQMKEGLLMQPDIIKKKFLLIGVEAKIDLETDFTDTLALLRNTLRNNLHLIKNKLCPVRMVGVWLPDMDGIKDEISSKRIYFTGVEVAKDEEIPAGFIVKDLPESLFARFREKSRGTMSRYAYTEWLPASGYLLNLDNVPGDFEIFDDMEHDAVEDECDILLPIQTA